MKYKSLVYSAASGKIGGIVYSRNASGAYTRALSVPVDPQSIYQTAVRNAFSFLADYWMSTLTAAQRAEWDLYASNVTVIDKLGDAIYISGFNHFVRSNTPFKTVFGSVVADGPANFNLGEVSNITVTASEATQFLSITFNAGDEWVSEDGAALFVYQSRPKNKSINFCKGPYRLVGTLLGNSAVPPPSPSDLAAVFPFVEDQRLFLRFNVHRVDGRLSTSLVTFCPCAA